MVLFASTTKHILSCGGSSYWHTSTTSAFLRLRYVKSACRRSIMDRSTDKGAIIAEIGAAKKAMRDRMKQILSGLEEDDVQKQCS